jgi:hypothetical protein
MRRSGIPATPLFALNSLKEDFMDKKEFLKYMGNIKNIYTFMDELNGLFRKHKMSGDQVWDSYSLLMDDCISLLEKNLDLELDNAGYSVLSWYIYENDFGKAKKKMLWYGKEVPIKTFDDLWEQIQREKGDKKNE